MTTLEFGLPSALLLAPPDADIPPEPLERVVKPDAFMPTGLLLQDDSTSPEAIRVDPVPPLDEGFGGTSTCAAFQDVHLADFPLPCVPV